jgi:hypothetical protein
VCCVLTVAVVVLDINAFINNEMKRVVCMKYCSSHINVKSEEVTAVFLQRGPVHGLSPVSLSECLFVLPVDRHITSPYVTSIYIQAVLHPE